jgi:hypothetical protein
VTPDTQAERLAALGASPDETDELLRYLENAFDLGALGPGTALPLPDEPFIATWEVWAEEGRQRGDGGAFAVLFEHLPQLRFPIREGISETEAYRAATRKGVPPGDLPEATGLPLEHPEAVELVLHESPAGRIPLVIARRREEFAALLRALSRKNEPVPVPDSQGALMISGYNNWARIQELRRRWEALPPSERETATWDQEMAARIVPRRELYQDRFVLLSNGPYSAIPASDLGLDEDEWKEISLAIRRDHECVHYFTRRLFGSMRNNVLDELMADWAGMVAALGRFRADWFLRFLGLEDHPRYRPGGRLDLYRGAPPLSDGAFRVLHTLIRSAAENLESFDVRFHGRPRTLSERALVLTALASLRLDDIASPEGVARLEQALESVRRRLGW